MNTMDNTNEYKPIPKAIFDELTGAYLQRRWDRIKHAKTKGILKNGKRWYPNPKGRLCGEVCTLVLNESFWSTGNKFLNGTCKVS